MRHEYDEGGNRLRTYDAKTQLTTFTYDSHDRLTRITDPLGGQTTYQYDAVSNLTQLTNARGHSTLFTYDAANRLTQVRDALNQTTAYQYDPVGNRTQMTDRKGQVHTYTYDAANRLTQTSAGGQTISYTYDANGNLTATSTGRTFTWDVFNRLTQATGPGGTVTYTYDGDGLKRQRVGPDGTRRYYYDGIKPIWETDGAGVMTAQLDRDIFGNLLSRREASGARRYYHFDGVGSTTALTNESGAATSTLLYDAWGNQRAATGSDQGRYRFTGAELDAATGLYHMGARFYDPTIGRWLSEDPVQDKPFEPVSLNLYAYVSGNPINRIDPAGTEDMGGGGGGCICGGSPPKSAADRLQEFIDQALEAQRIKDYLHTIGAGRFWDAIMGFLQRHEGVFTTLGVSLTFVAAAIAVVAIGTPGLIGAAILLGGAAFFTTTMMALSHFHHGRLTREQAALSIGASALGLWGPGAVANAWKAGTLSLQNAGLIISWFGARDIALISPFMMRPR